MHSEQGSANLFEILILILLDIYSEWDHWIPFIIVSETIKHLQINLILKILVLENYIGIVKEIKCGTNKWKDIPCSWRQIILLKSLLPNLQI